MQAPKPHWLCSVILHADTYLVDHAADQIRDSIANGQSCWSFSTKIDATGLSYRMIELGNAMRVRWLRMAYGDQGIFVTRELFERLGGFDDVSFMEDFLFSQKLRKKSRFALLPGPITVSARRWQSVGVVRQTLSNWLTIWRFLNGADPNELKYDREQNAHKKSGTD